MVKRKGRKKSIRTDDEEERKEQTRINEWMRGKRAANPPRLGW